MEGHYSIGSGLKIPVDTYPFRWRMVFEEAPFSGGCVDILISLLAKGLDIFNGAVQQLVLEQTRIRQTVTCRFTAFPLLLTILRRILIRFVDGSEIRLPIIVRSTNNQLINVRNVIILIDKGSQPKDKGL